MMTPTPAAALADLAAVRRDLEEIASRRPDSPDFLGGETLIQMAVALEGVGRTLEALEARGGRLEAVLRRLEWCREREEDLEPMCPTCGIVQWAGHAPDCDLAAALAGGPEETTR